MTGLRSFAVSALAVLMAAGLASAQPPQRITPNFKDADITQVAEAVAAATGKNFIIDPRVRAQVTMLSSTAMTPPAFYEAFLSILQVYGFIAVPAGDVVKILPDANARQFPAVDLPEDECVVPEGAWQQFRSGVYLADALVICLRSVPIPGDVHLECGARVVRVDEVWV